MAVSRKKYNKRFYSGKKRPLEDMLIIYIGVFFGVGVFMGALYASFISSEGLRGFYGHADNVIRGIELYGMDKNHVFRESLFKYGKTVFILWFLSFIPFGSIASLLVLGVKGASVGFATAVLVRFYDFKGLWYCIILYFPQTVIIVTSYFILAYFCFKEGAYQKAKKPLNKEKGLGEKLLFLIIASAGIVMGCFFEAYISPGLISAIL